jgi:hypothetical protein
MNVDLNRGDFVQWVRDALRQHKQRAPMPGDRGGSNTTSKRRGTSRAPELVYSRPASDDETSLARLATKMMQVHGAFATKGLRGVRDENDRSVPLSLALKAMAMLQEQRQ